MDLIICIILLGGWLLLLSGGYALTEAITRRIGQRKNALSGCSQIKRQGELDTSPREGPLGGQGEIFGQEFTFIINRSGGKSK